MPERDDHQLSAITSDRPRSAHFWLHREQIDRPAVSNLISRSVGGVFSGRSIGVMFSLLTVDTDATSVFGETRPLSIGGECVLLDEVSREIAEFPCSTHV